MEESFAGELAVHHPDRKLVTDECDLTRLGLVPGELDHVEHPSRDQRVRLAPTRLKRVAEFWPQPRVTQRLRSEARGSFEQVPRLNETVIRVDLEAKVRGPGHSGLLRALQRARVEPRDGMPDPGVRRLLRHQLAKVAQSEVLETAVKNMVGVENLTVTNEVDEIGGHARSLRVGAQVNSWPVTTRTPIKQLAALDDGQVLVSGWVETVRDQKKVQFVVLRDESGALQLVHPRETPVAELVDPSTSSGTDQIADAISALTLGSFVTVT